MLHFLQLGAFLLCFCYRGALFTDGGLYDFFSIYNYRGLYAVFLLKQGLFHHVGALIFVFMGRGAFFGFPPPPLRKFLHAPMKLVFFHT